MRLLLSCTLSIALFSCKSTSSNSSDTSAAISNTARHVFQLSEILTQEKCISVIKQIDRQEAVCEISVPGIDGRVTHLVLDPMVLDREFESQDRDAPQCSGGLRRDANLENKIQLTVSLSPWSGTHTRAQFEKCFIATIDTLNARNRKIHLDVFRLNSSPLKK